MTDQKKLIADLENIILTSRNRTVSLQAVADATRRSGNYRWVGLYDVDHAAAVVRNVVFSGPGAPAHPQFAITKGLTGAAVAQKRTVNVGDVSADARYLTAFGTTKSEIIVPIFDQVKQKVIGTIDVESELRDAFSHETQALLERCADLVRPLWLENNNCISTERARMPAGSEAILNARSLKTAHLHLASLLHSGLKVLDVGCGTGSITAGIAEAVSPQGHAIGIDINVSLIEEARALHAKIPNLSFAICDIYSIPFLNAFDIVSAARVLQWLSSPQDALRMLVAAAKRGGRIVVLDYNHEKIRWNPSPPHSVRLFYDALLQW